MPEIFSNIERTRLWTPSCIRPNDPGSPNFFDKRCVKVQTRSLLPNLAPQKIIKFVAEKRLSEFCEQYIPTTPGSGTERITQCARANGWREGLDFMVGKKRMEGGR